MSVNFLPQQSASTNILREWLAVGKTIWQATYGGGSTIQVQKSTDQGATFAAPVTVDSTAGNNDVMLNDPMALDDVTGRLHLMYGRQTQTGTSPTLLHKYSDDQGATWSTEHVIDSLNRGNNRFFRVGIVAHNGNISVWYTSEDHVTFTTDGLWLAQSSDGGATWGASVKKYTGTLVNPYEPNVSADGQYAIATWYDPGVVANNSGPIYCSVTRDGGATWSASATLVATGPTHGYGRPRPSLKNGKIIIAAQGYVDATQSQPDLETITSLDMGATWAAPVQRINFSNISGRMVNHPDVRMVGNRVFLFWNDQIVASPTTYGYMESDDGGSTFGAIQTGPLTTTGGGDAPRLWDTDDYLIFLGYDSSLSKTNWVRWPIFAAQPGSLNVLDNFVRADESPLSDGGKWTAGIASATPLRLVSDAAQRTQTSGTFRRDGSWWNANTFGASTPQAVAATIIAVGSDATNGVVDLYLVNKAAGAYYGLDGPCNGTSHYTLFRKSGSQTTVATALQTMSAGDVLELQIDGNDVIGWLTTTAGSVYEMFRYTDAAFIADAFNPGIEITAQNDTTPTRLGAFSGAQLTAPISTAAPTITGTVAAGQVLSVSSDATWATANGATPQRWAYQWQTSPDGITWTNVSGATLPFFTVSDATKRHRCVVTTSNTIGSTPAASNALAPTIAASATLSGTLSLSTTSSVAHVGRPSPSSATLALSARAIVSHTSLVTLSATLGLSALPAVTRRLAAGKPVLFEPVEPASIRLTSP